MLNEEMRGRCEAVVRVQDGHMKIDVRTLRPTRVRHRGIEGWRQRRTRTDKDGGRTVNEPKQLTVL